MACALAVMACIATAVHGADPGPLWSAHCAECHGHVAEFTRERLRLIDGVLGSRNVSGDLRQFLAAHHAGDAEVHEIYAMLLGHAGAAPRFRNQCGSCHGEVATLARGSLVRRGGFLYGRRSNWRLDIFLNGHMGIGEYDVPFYVQLLDIAERDARRR